MKKMISLITCMLVLVLSLTACSQAAPPPETGNSLFSGGVLVLSVNPEIAVEYDEDGLVTGIIARNEDALAIIANCEGLIGKPARNVVTDLVTRIGNAGYFVEEIDGNPRQITLEIEPGSTLPNGTFLEDVISDVQDCIENHDWTTPLNVESITDYGKTDYIPLPAVPLIVEATNPMPQPNRTDYGKTDYDDTDYGPNNDGVTDFGKTDYDVTDYGTEPVPTEPAPTEPAPTEPVPTEPAPQPNRTDYGKTDYDDTDYGPNNDGVTDFGKTDYDVTDYGTEPVPTEPAPTEPAPTEPAPQPNRTDYGKTDYDDTDYGPNNDGVTDFGKTDYEDGKTDYEDGKTDYEDGKTDYDGETDYAR